MGQSWQYWSKAEGGALNNSVFGQVAELHVPEGLPGTDHGDVRAQALHAGDVVSEPTWIRQQKCQYEYERQVVFVSKGLRWQMLEDNACILHVWF